MFLVVNGGIEQGMAAVTAAYGDQTKVLCTPLRPYESFAEHVLGLDSSLTAPSTQKLGTDGRLFWLHFTIEYAGECFSHYINLTLLYMLCGFMVIEFSLLKCITMNL